MRPRGLDPGNGAREVGDLWVSGRLAQVLWRPLTDETIGAPILILPIANHEKNHHGKKENIRLQNLLDGIEMYAAVLTGLGH